MYAPIACSSYHVLAPVPVGGQRARSITVLADSGVRAEQFACGVGVSRQRDPTGRLKSKRPVSVNLAGATGVLNSDGASPYEKVDSAAKARPKYSLAW